LLETKQKAEQQKLVYAAAMPSSLSLVSNHNKARDTASPRPSCLGSRQGWVLKSGVGGLNQLRLWFLSRWLRAIKRGSELSKFGKIHGCGFVAAIASSVDYQAPSHIDEDFFLSIHQLNVMNRFGDKEVAQYFCFASLVVCVELRPGDVLLFNPHVQHCLSQKTKAYQGDRVHVSTMYIKTKHVSGNDVDAELTQEELTAMEQLDAPEVVVDCKL